MAANQVVSGSLASWNTVPAVSRTCRLQRLHWNSSRVPEPAEAPAAAGGAGQALAPAHREERLAARLLGPEPLPELGLAQALDRAPQPVRRCHPLPPPAPKAAESLARRRMRVRRNQVGRRRARS